MSKVTIALSFLMLGVVLSSRPVSAKTVTQNLEMLQGSTRCIEHNCSDVKKIAIKNKKYISTKGKSYMIKVTAKKAGKTSFTYRLSGDKNTYKCNVKVYSLKSVKKKATAKLKKQLAALSEGTSYTYLDFNKDGVNELFHDGNITYYDSLTESDIKPKEYMLYDLSNYRLPQTEDSIKVAKKSFDMDYTKITSFLQKDSTKQ